MKFLNKIDGADKLITDANNRLVKDTDISNWNNKSDKGHKHTKNEITDFPVSLPANGGNADTVGGKSPSDFTLQSYTDSYIRPVNNVARVNLGSPTVTEMALIDSQATNKIWFHPLDKMIFEESDDGITFNVRSDISDTDKRKLVSGNSNASIKIPKGKYFRITIFPRSYVYLNWIYMYFSTSGNKVRFKCEKKRDDGDWITHFDYTNLVSGWPGHIFIPHSTIAFSPNSISGHYNQVRITIATEEQTNQYPNMALRGLEWWGGYPRGSRDIFSYDEYQNVTFPEELKAKTFKNASGKEVAYQNDIPVKLSELNKDINFDERYYTKSETYTKTEVNTKLDGKVDNSRVLTDVPLNAKFTDTIYTHPSTHPASMITESTTKRFVSDTEKSMWNSKAEITDIPTKVGQLENDKNYVTQEELESATYDSMVKSVYDKDDDGIVDVAETVIGNEIQLGNYKLVYNSTTNSLDIEVIA